MGDIILKGDQDWKKWTIKWGKGLIAVTTLTAVTYTATYLNANPLPVDPKYIFLTGLLVTLLNQVGNWLQHA
jgi:hypothetical protein